jgi:membrane-associated protease RseP (regulator of RpoE activity)
LDVLFIFSIVFLCCSYQVQLGILNALPLPALDGGQMAFIILEALRRGKKLDIRKQVLIE